jgi:bisphosphoglycerate-dependent phosphoglycerate mutase
VSAVLSRIKCIEGTLDLDIAAIELPTAEPRTYEFTAPGVYSRIHFPPAGLNTD